MVEPFLAYYQATVKDFFGVNENFKHLYNSTVSLGAGYMLVSGVYDMSYTGVTLAQATTSPSTELFL